MHRQAAFGGGAHWSLCKEARSEAAEWKRMGCGCCPGFASRRAVTWDCIEGKEGVEDASGADCDFAATLRIPLLSACFLCVQNLQKLSFMLRQGWRLSGEVHPYFLELPTSLWPHLSYMLSSSTCPHALCKVFPHRDTFPTSLFFSWPPFISTNRETHLFNIFIYPPPY